MDNLNFEQLKADVHRTLIAKMDLEKLATVNNGRARQAVANLVLEIVAQEKVPLNAGEKDRIQAELLDEIFGLGPLEPLLQDPSISDILVTTPKLVYIERAGKLYRTPVEFKDDAHLLRIIEKVVSRVGRRVDESSPLVDARLPDGSRV